MTPNLFAIATKELSHDAVITWLLQWANPTYKNEDHELHQCGLSLLKTFIPHLLTEKIIEVTASRQRSRIDIWTEIILEDNSKILLIIENKVFANEHNNQLERYKELAELYAKENGFRLECVYVKIGSQAGKITKSIQQKGFRVIDRNMMLAGLNVLPATANQIFNDYRSFLQHIEDLHQRYLTLPIGKWDDNAWVGFYLYVESQIEINMWHFVNNPSGGFWNMCLNWGYWHAFPIYMQIEQGKLCYKIAVHSEETNGDNSKMDVNVIQKYIHEQLIDFAIGSGYAEIKKPVKQSWTGGYRTIAIVEQDKWLGDANEILEPGKAISSIRRQFAFYDQFIKFLADKQYDNAGFEFITLVKDN
ncbi:PD-(D/E)XK nuclease family protein [Chitinophaga sp. NPDC101104]|uniref:PD-(D/E)XK nuclease family protein n=1 Tax=Chitinophaga sp. NPDC101104 TaxID=3390561 RepID=UPI003CFD6B05